MSNLNYSDVTLKAKIKRKVKEILNEKKVNKTGLSEKLGYEKTFINAVLSKPDKFFNLDHIEKICAALDYPVSQLFADVEREPMGLTPAEIDLYTYNKFLELERKAEDVTLGFTELREKVGTLTPEKQKMLMSLLKQTTETFTCVCLEGEERKKAHG